MDASCLSQPPPAPSSGVDATIESGAPSYSVVEKICLLLSQISMFVLIAVVGTDILTRSLLNYSFEIADEVGGYMLVGIAFFSLAVCQAHDGFHRVEFVLDRLSARARIGARLVYDAVALSLALLLAWYLWSYVSGSWSSGTAAPTRLMTPFWLAQLPMVLGLLAYIASLCGAMARHAALLRSAPLNSARPSHGR